MFSIGSGIAALYPLAKSIIDNESEETKIFMYSGFHSYNHIPLIKELRILTDFWNFECTMCLSQKSKLFCKYELTKIFIKSMKF